MTWLWIAVSLPNGFCLRRILGQAQQLLLDVVAAGGRLIVLDLVFPEVVNAIWKRRRQRLITLSEAELLLAALRNCPVHVEPAMRLLREALQIAMHYDRAVYDSLFVALAQDLAIPGVTADEPLYNSLGASFSQIKLLRNWK